MSKKSESKVSIEKEVAAVRNLTKEFKEFISRGNVVDLAVGVIIGGAFGKIVSSLVSDIIMPLIGILLGGADLSALAFNIGDARIAYGSFLQNIIDFLIIGASIFLFVKLINSFNRKKKTEEEPATPPKDDPQVALLKEIRDELKKSRK